MKRHIDLIAALDRITGPIVAQPARSARDLGDDDPRIHYAEENRVFEGGRSEDDMADAAAADDWAKRGDER